MRKLIYIALIAVLFSSCLDENPSYTLNSKTAFEDLRTAQMALNGCYGQLTTYASYGQGIQEVFVGASGISWAQTNDGDPDRYCSLDIAPASVGISGYWSGMYKTISECNFFIKNMSEGPLDARAKTEMIAQAKFIRGLCYFNLYATFGEVPLRNSPSTEATLSLVKATKEEIIAQIENDFLDGTRDLTDKKIDGRADMNAAKAYLAKLYWFLACQDNVSSSPYWAKSKTYCDLVTTDANYDLQPKFGDLFVNHVNQSKESIFQLNFTTTSSSTGNRGNWLFAPQVSTKKGVSWGRNRVNKSFHDWFVGTSIDDPRYEETFLYTWVNRNNNKVQYAYPYLAYMQLGAQVVEKLDYASFADPTNPQLSELTPKQIAGFTAAVGDHNGWAFFKKQFDYESEAQNSNKNLILFRFADFLLMQADVENELGNKSVAIGLANRVLTRARTSSSVASLTPANWSNSLSTDQVRKNIYRERLFEMAGEPSMYTDARARGPQFLKELLEIHNNHVITKAFATNPNVGAHKFKDRLFDKGNLSDIFLKKNLRMPIPQSEINGNEALTSADQNYGY